MAPGLLIMTSDLIWVDRSQYRADLHSMLLMPDHADPSFPTFSLQTCLHCEFRDVLVNDQKHFNLRIKRSHEHIQIRTIRLCALTGTRSAQRTPPNQHFWTLKASAPIWPFNWCSDQGSTKWQVETPRETLRALILYLRSGQDLYHRPPGLS